jgi:tryptophan synthase beta chain
MMVRDFQAVIGRETRKQILKSAGRLPDYLVACVGGGSNSLGLCFDFLEEPSVRMIGVEAGGLGIGSGRHAARFATGELGILHGTMSFVLQDGDGQIQTTHSVSAGLDYPSVGPEHSYYRDLGRIDYVSATDDEALEAFQLLSELEGLIPALESAHAVAHVKKLAPTLERDQVVVINLSGRGDKDVEVAAKLLGRSEGLPQVGEG